MEPLNLAAVIGRISAACSAGVVKHDEATVRLDLRQVMHGQYIV